MKRHRTPSPRHLHTPGALRCMYKSIAIKCASRPNRQSAVGWVSAARALPNGERWVTACGLTQPTERSSVGGVETPRNDHLPQAFIQSITIGCALARRQKKDSLPPPQPSPTGGGSLSVEADALGSSISNSNATTAVTFATNLPLLPVGQALLARSAREGWGEGGKRAAQRQKTFPAGRKRICRGTGALLSNQLRFPRLHTPRALRCMYKSPRNLNTLNTTTTKEPKTCSTPSPTG